MKLNKNGILVKWYAMGRRLINSVFNFKLKLLLFSIICFFFLDNKVAMLLLGHYPTSSQTPYSNPYYNFLPLEL